jgi:hypothetical protein
VRYRLFGGTNKRGIVRHGTPLLAWTWVMVVLAAYLAQFRDIAIGLAKAWLK